MESHLVVAKAKPGAMYVIFHGERVMAKINVQDFDVAFPEKSAEDVVKRTLTIGGSGTGDPALQSEFVFEFELDEAGPASQRITILEGQVGVLLQLVDTDNAGNDSEPSEKLFDATDIQSPAVPGELGVSFAGERIIDVP